MSILGKNSSIAICTICITLAFLSTAPAVMAARTVEACNGKTCGRVTRDSIVIDGVLRTIGEKAQTDRSPGRLAVAVVPAVFEFVRSQVCGGPGFVPEGGTGCATAGCVNPAATRFITARRPATGLAGAPWAPVGDGCTAPGTPAAGTAPVVTVGDVIATEFAQLPLAGATTQVQPAVATLVNVDTIFYTDPGVQVFDVVILGQNVTVTATPTAYTWVFGDGATLGPTASPGAPYPAQDITHVYTQPGRVPARGDVSFTGTFAVAGGPATPIPGQVTIPGTEIEVWIRQARSQLIATP